MTLLWNRAQSRANILRCLEMDTLFLSQFIAAFQSELAAYIEALITYGKKKFLLWYGQQYPFSIKVIVSTPKN